MSKFPMHTRFTAHSRIDEHYVTNEEFTVCTCLITIYTTSQKRKAVSFGIKKPFLCCFWQKDSVV